MRSKVLFEDPILDYLAQPAVLETAVEIADQVEKIRDAYHRKFWDMVHKELAARIRDTGLRTWTVDRTIPTGSLTKPWLGFSISPLAANNEKQRPWLRPCLHQGESATRFRLYYGLKWTTVAAPSSSPDIERLRSEMLRDGFTMDDQRWIGWQWLNHHIFHKEFMARMSQDSKELVEKVVNPVWNLFLTNRESLETIHKT